MLPAFGEDCSELAIEYDHSEDPPKATGCKIKIRFRQKRLSAIFPYKTKSKSTENDFICFPKFQKYCPKTSFQRKQLFNGEEEELDTVQPCDFIILYQCFDVVSTIFSVLLHSSENFRKQMYTLQLVCKDWYNICKSQCMKNLFPPRYHATFETDFFHLESSKTINSNFIDIKLEKRQNIHFSHQIAPPLPLNDSLEIGFFHYSLLPTDLEIIFSNFDLSGIKKLTLKNSVIETDEDGTPYYCVFSIIKYFPNLEELFLYGCCGSTYTMNYISFENCEIMHKLKKLSLKGFYNFQRKSKPIPLKHLNCLTALESLNYCGPLKTKYGIPKTLKHVKITGFELNAPVHLQTVHLVPSHSNYPADLLRIQGPQHLSCHTFTFSEYYLDLLNFGTIEFAAIYQNTLEKISKCSLKELRIEKPHPIYLVIEIFSKLPLEKIYVNCALEKGVFFRLVYRYLRKFPLKISQIIPYEEFNYRFKEEEDFLLPGLKFMQKYQALTKQPVQIRSHYYVSSALKPYEIASLLSLCTDHLNEHGDGAFLCPETTPPNQSLQQYFHTVWDEFKSLSSSLECLGSFNILKTSNYSTINCNIGRYYRCFKFGLKAVALKFFFRFFNEEIHMFDPIGVVACIFASLVYKNQFSKQNFENDINIFYQNFPIQLFNQKIIPNYKLSNNAVYKLIFDSESPVLATNLSWLLFFETFNTILTPDT